MKKILVTGGSGMVGTYLRKLLPEASYPSSTELNLLSADSISSYFKKNKFTHVIHLAAHVPTVSDNLESRVDYLDKNIIMNTLITKLSYEAGIKNFMGVLSNTVYPEKCNIYPLQEKMIYEGCPHESLMPYAYAKRIHALQLDNYRISRSVNYNYIIPCNLYGPQGSKKSGFRHFLNDLVLKAILANKNKSDLILFGDGKPLRQFMHAKDLAKIIVLFLKKNISISCNVAPDDNISINRYAETVLKILKFKHIKITYNKSNPGQLRKEISNELMKTYIGDFKFTPLEEGIMDLYNYYNANL